MVKFQGSIIIFEKDMNFVLLVFSNITLFLTDINIIFLCLVCVSFAHLLDFYQYSLFHRKDLLSNIRLIVLLNLMNRYVISASELFLKNKDIVDLSKYEWLI